MRSMRLLGAGDMNIKVIDDDCTDPVSIRFEKSHPRDFIQLAGSPRILHYFILPAGLVFHGNYLLIVTELGSAIYLIRSIHDKVLKL